MTSKEFTDILSKSPKSCNLYVMFEKEVNEIKKDLEILDILKKWFLENTVDYRDYDNTLFIDTFIRSEEDKDIFKILGEWLENDKC